MKILCGLLAVCFLAATILTTWEGGQAMLFGWLPFLGRVVPRMTIDWASTSVGIGAFVLFAVGVHGMAVTWQKQRREENGGGSWRIRWTLSVVTIVIVLFTAGIATIGVVHQIGWLFRAEHSLYAEKVQGWGSGNPDHNLKHIGIGLHTHHDFFKRFPSGCTLSPDGTMLHSWETQALAGLWYSPEGIDMTKPWNDPVNQKYFKCILPQFINPGLRTPKLEDSEGYGLSHYAANSHVLAGNKSMKIEDIKDGTANTLLVGEANAQFKPWGHPVNWRDPTLGINRSPRGFGGPPSRGGATFVMADGSIRFVSDKISPDVLRALSTPNGGEEIREEGWVKK